ncbi:DUF3667 domain-containing protein [Pelagicoccus sp. SDUM812005]|uniref:DUF3667 domain-containing protein n=1 Tax=Pelagicoccus sp. SDUM812005 TaxID=3041257 RepID=UPI00280EE149|nr:DUF3667 domain-containing protein [Pelagicoccus sp. SDUM812005]MDQ8179608.1 DUF3667 domain-containing protein [Pelagicoccus sp. SDUM812005]
MSTPVSSSAPKRCLNCSAEIHSTYCPSCGQRDLDFKKDWRGLVGEFASSLLNIDGKVPQGIIRLLFLPGSMTATFLDGKRASQMPPLRLYLFASLLFFLWFNSQQDPDLVATPTLSTAEAPASENALSNGNSGAALSAKMQEKFESPEAFLNAFNTWLPRVLLLGVPLLALATRLVFRRRGYVYLEHVIISMHLQTFLLLWVFLIGLSSDLISLASPKVGELVWGVFIWWIQLYPVFALRRIFQLTWTKAIFATLFLEFVFLVMLAAGVALVLLISFFWA